MNPDKIREIEEKLADINRIISGLDPAIRSAAFEILAPYYFDEELTNSAQKPAAKGKDTGTPSTTPAEFESFFSSFDHKKPKDNVLLIAAWLYSQHGVFPISAKDTKNYADRTGLTVPKRPDNTMRSAKKNGKSLFRQSGDGWELTVHGETYVKETYGVKKGTKARVSEGVE